MTFVATGRHDVTAVFGGGRGCDGDPWRTRTPVATANAKPLCGGQEEKVTAVVVTLTRLPGRTSAGTDLAYPWQQPLRRRRPWWQRPCWRSELVGHHGGGGRGGSARCGSRRGQRRWLVAVKATAAVAAIDWRPQRSLLWVPAPVDNYLPWPVAADEHGAPPVAATPLPPGRCAAATRPWQRQLRLQCHVSCGGWRAHCGSRCDKARTSLAALDRASNRLNFVIFSTPRSSRSPTTLSSSKH